MADNVPTRAMTVRHVARRQNVDEKTVYRLAQGHEPPGFKAASQWRFRRTAIDSRIEVKTHAAGVQPTNHRAVPSDSSRED